MNRTKNIIFQLLIIIPFAGYSQNILIKDKGTDLPLQGVNIYSDHYGTTTDSSGGCNLLKFNLNQ